MEETLLVTLEAEIREEFHIPPYFENLANLIKQSHSYLSMLVDNVDYDVDLVARDLLKNRTFYAYNDKVNEFAIDYAHDILTWQFSKISVVTDETEETETEENEGAKNGE